MHAQQREEYEPVDKPVRLYEKALFLAAQLLTIAALSTHFPAVELAAAASMACTVRKLRPDRLTLDPFIGARLFSCASLRFSLLSNAELMTKVANTGG